MTDAQPNGPPPRPCSAPGCTEMATLDMSDWPPRKDNGEATIYYECPAGHRVATTVTLFMKPKRPAE